MPPSASSKRPLRAWSAPVNEPFSWPYSSLSISVAGSSVQPTLTRGTAAAVRVAMDDRGQQVLAHARLAAQQHVGVRAGADLDHPLDALPWPPNGR